MFNPDYDYFFEDGRFLRVKKLDTIKKESFCSDIVPINAPVSEVRESKCYDVFEIIKERDKLLLDNSRLLSINSDLCDALEDKNRSLKKWQKI